MNKIIISQNVSILDEHERIELIQQLGVDKFVFDYIKVKLQNLSIEIGGDCEGNVIELMNRGLLEGWCWQTTESAIVFFDDDDYIERGNLIIAPDNEYWHSWICFKFNDNIWVFDPCLQIIVEKNVYYHVFEIKEIAGSVTANLVKQELIYRVNNREKDKRNESKSQFSQFLTQYMSERQKNETHVLGNTDVKSTMYMNNTGYTATIDIGKINSLIAHYYFNA